VYGGRVFPPLFLSKGLFMFTESDVAMVKVLIGILAQKVKFQDLNAKDVNSVYHSFEFLNSLEAKIKEANSLKYDFEDLKEYCEKLEEEAKALEEEEAEEKPKRRTRKKV
jgi:hypothetical protein